MTNPIRTKPEVSVQASNALPINSIITPNSTPKQETKTRIPSATPDTRNNAKISTEVTEVSLRSSPGYIGKSKSDIITTIPHGAIVEIIKDRGCR